MTHDKAEVTEAEEGKDESEQRAIISENPAVYIPNVWPGTRLQGR